LSETSWWVFEVIQESGLMDGMNIFTVWGLLRSYRKVA
jgi:hypothetical protein